MHADYRPGFKRLIIIGFLLLPFSVLVLLLKVFITPLKNIGPQKYYYLQQGMSAKKVLASLRTEGMITFEQSFFLNLYVKFNRMDKSIKAGKYKLTPKMHAYDLLNKMVRGEVTPSYFRIEEGKRFEDVLKLIQVHPDLKHTLTGLPAEIVYQKLSGKPGGHYEGWLFPDTYHFNFGNTDFSLLQTAYQLMHIRLGQVWESRTTSNMLQTPYEALILASIIEKEASTIEERYLISGVFQRRLLKNMRLQADPTVIYGLGSGYQGRLSKANLLADTPYNSYTRKGLPPSPIALPGLASLKAAVAPEPGTALYFVSKGDGTHHFSSTLEEHNNAVNLYQKERNNL